MPPKRGGKAQQQSREEQQSRPQSAQQQQQQPQAPRPQQPQAIRPQSAQVPPQPPVQQQAPRAQGAWGRPAAPSPVPAAPVQRPPVSQITSQPPPGWPRAQVPQAQPQRPTTPSAPKPAWGQPAAQPAPIPTELPKEPPKRAEEPPQSTISSITEEVGAMEISKQPPKKTPLELELPSLREALVKYDFPRKPRERCNLGREIKLWVNHFGLNVPSFGVYQYDVKILKEFRDKKGKLEEKPIETKDMARWMFEELMKRYPGHRNKVFYDFKKILFSVQEFPDPLEYKIVSPEDKNEYIFRMQKVSLVNVDKNNIEPIQMQALQLLLTHTLSLNYVEVGRSFFKEDTIKRQLGFNFNMWKGFYVSVRPSEEGLTINMDVAHSTFFESGNLIDLACKYFNCGENQLVQVFADVNNARAFISVLKGRKVKLTHLKYTKRIENIGPAASKHKITEQNVTISDYFQTQYKIKLKYPHLPCIHLGKDNYTPMELLTTELENVRKLTPDQTADMIKETAVPAFNRRDHISTLMKNSGFDRDPVLKQYNISAKFQLMDVTGRVLNAPDLLYGDRKILRSQEIGNKGQWDNMNKKFLYTYELRNWIVISFARRTNDDVINDFIGALINVGGRHGIKVSDPITVAKGNPRATEEHSYTFIEKLIKQYNNLRFILVILPGTSPIYGALKTLGDIEYGISTQAIDENTIFRQRGRYDRLVSNICLKINPKLGGKNFSLSSASDRLFQQYLQSLYDGPLMIFGADVNHPAPTDKNYSESIAATVGSIDKECCYYAARLLTQIQPRQQALELIYDLRKMVKPLLDEYFKVNKAYPKRLLFLRDGVSEGQFKKVVSHEMNEIRAACQEINTGYKPGITFVVVTKRHHTRFFPQNKNDESGRCGNVPPGTMVDCKVITPDLYDFFLCSHMGIQGTSKPCHYYILHDDNEFKMNQIALLCHYLCHIYSRSSTSVSYPAPTYYADLVAARGREYVRRKKPIQNVSTIQSFEINLHPNFKNNMFYI